MAKGGGWEKSCPLGLKQIYPLSIVVIKDTKHEGSREPEGSTPSPAVGRGRGPASGSSPRSPRRCCTAPVALVPPSAASGAPLPPSLRPCLWNPGAVVRSNLDPSAGLACRGPFWCDRLRRTRTLRHFNPTGPLEQTPRVCLADPGPQDSWTGHQDSIEEEGPRFCAIRSFPPPISPLAKSPPPSNRGLERMAFLCFFPHFDDLGLEKSINQKTPLNRGKQYAWQIHGVVQTSHPEHSPCVGVPGAKSSGREVWGRAGGPWPGMGGPGHAGGSRRGPGQGACPESG